MGAWVWGLGFGVWGLGFGVSGVGFGVWGVGFAVWGRSSAWVFGFAGIDALSFQGGLVSKAHRLLNHSNLGLRATRKKPKNPCVKNGMREDEMRVRVREMEPRGGGEH